VGIGLMLLTFAWAGGNPPSASPDEPENFIKTVSVGHLQFSGAPYASSTAPLSELAKSWFVLTGRSYQLPAVIAPTPKDTCYQFEADKTAACQSDPRKPVSTGMTRLSTAQGTYEPFLYFLPGFATLGSHNFYDAQLRARLVNGAFAGLFLIWAAFLLWRGRRDLVALGGLALGITPMVIFLSAAVTTNGTETAAAACLWAALLRLARDRETGDQYGRGAWIAAGVSGAVLALSRMLDPLFIAMLVLAIVVALGFRGTRDRVRAGGRTAWAAIGAVTLAGIVTLVWDYVVMPHPPFSMSVAKHALPTAVKQLPNQVRQAIGVFGWNDTSMPNIGYALWLLVVLVLAGLALRFGNRRERLMLISLVVAIALLDIAVAAGVEAQVGFGMQVRYLLPLTVGIPMVAAEIVSARWQPAASRQAMLAAVIFAVAGLMQLGGWLTNVHRYAVGRSGGWMLPWKGDWAPIGGWLPWTAFAVVGAGLIVAPAVVAARRPQAAAVSTKIEEPAAI
jgi:hypothetical protein